MDKIRIGILSKNFADLEFYELRIIDEISKNPKYDLVVFILDHDEVGIKRSVYHRLLRQLSSKFSDVLFRFQINIEKKLYLKGGSNRNVNFNFDSVSKINCKVERGKYTDEFSPNDIAKINKLNLDLLVRFGFRILKGEILNSAKYGIWSFHHADNYVNRGGPAGFWEVINRSDCVGVTLQKLTNSLDGGVVISKAFVNRYNSFYVNNTNIKNISVELFLKSLSQLANKKLVIEASLPYSFPLYKNPNLFNVFKYLVIFYRDLVLRKVKLLLESCKLIFFDVWKLYYSDGNVFERPLYKAISLSPPRGHFYADPFLIKFNGQKYIFFEDYDYRSKKGVLKSGIIEKKSIKDIRTLNISAKHLSFPYIFEYNNEIFLLPEMDSGYGVNLYKSITFPHEWELVKQAFPGETFVDSTLFFDKECIWLLTSKKTTDILPENNLFIYRIKDINFSEIIPHQNNPVYLDTRHSRNAGAVFSVDGKLFRPSQRNVFGRYGFSINVRELVRISDSEFIEVDCALLGPNFRKDLSGIHHICQLDKSFCFDASVNFIV